jgi:hypothetical protein
MGDKRAKATSAERVHGPLDSQVKRPRRRLEQNPPSRSPEAHRCQVVIGQAIEHLCRDFPTREHARVASCRRQRRSELRSPRRELRDPDGVIRANVRRGADGRYTVGLCLQRHRDGIVEIARAVVDPGEQVAVEVDRALNNAATRG